MDTPEKAKEYRLALLRTRVTELEALVKLYETQLLLARRRQFGASSEKTEADLRQTNLFGDAQTAAPEEPETQEVSYRRKKRKSKPVAEAFSRGRERWVLFPSLGEAAGYALSQRKYLDNVFLDTYSEDFLYLP